MKTEVFENDYVQCTRSLQIKPSRLWGQEWSRNYISFSSGRTKSDSELAQLLGGDFFKKEEILNEIMILLL